MQKEDLRRPENADPVEKFIQLRATLLALMRPKINGRYDSMSAPTQQEILLGTYLEHIEPQVYDAVMTLFAKGYTTITSGFGFAKPDSILSPAMQLISFHDQHSFDDEIQKRLGEIDAYLWYSTTAPIISFCPIRANLDEIQHAWDQIADILPDLHQTPLPSNSSLARVFRTRMCAMEEGSPEEVILLYPELYPNN